MVGRGTRGYVALEWESQRFMYLKDAWRPYYAGVDSEGVTLAKLNANKVRNVPTLVRHEDACTREERVDGTNAFVGIQETEASKYAPHVRRKVVDGENIKATIPSTDVKQRIILPLPSKKAKENSANAHIPATAPGGPPLTPSYPSLPTPMTADLPSRGGKRSASDLEPDDPHKQGSSLRHMTHYRIVVAEICLDSTQFTCAKEWMKVILDCVDGKSFSKIVCVATF